MSCPRRRHAEVVHPALRCAALHCTAVSQARNDDEGLTACRGGARHAKHTRVAAGQDETAQGRAGQGMSGQGGTHI